MLEYRKMSENEMNECVQLVSEAFYNYEYFSAYVREKKRRERFVNALMRCEFKVNMGDPAVKFITARQDGRIVAVAELWKPGFKRPSDVHYCMSGYLRALFFGGIRDVTAWLETDRKASAPCHERPGRNWYLNVLAVARSDEGKGIGSRFLKE